MEQAAAVIRRREKRARYCDRVRVLTCAAEYPEFVSRDYPWVLNRINQLYKRKAAAFLNRCSTEIYANAAEDYLYAAQSGDLFMPYEAQMLYRITYNESCTVSLTFDDYQYTGGAHGSTYRTSDTWNLSKGTRMTLSDFFPEGTDYEAYIYKKIDAQVAEMIAAGDDIFFGEPEKLVRDNFDAEQFYLTREGIVIYYQLYSIAPYASGIVEFMIPFEPGAVIRPGCEPSA